MFGIDGIWFGTHVPPIHPSSVTLDFSLKVLKFMLLFYSTSMLASRIRSIPSANFLCQVLVDPWAGGFIFQSFMWNGRLNALMYVICAKFPQLFN